MHPVTGTVAIRRLGIWADHPVRRPDIEFSQPSYVYRINIELWIADVYLDSNQRNNKPHQVIQLTMKSVINHTSQNLRRV